LRVKADVMLVLAECLGHRLPNLADLSKHEISKHIAACAGRGSVHSEDADRTRVSDVDPVVARPCAAKRNLMLSTSQADVVTNLILALPQMPARSSRAAAEIEEAACGEVEVSRRRCVGIDA